VLVISVFTIITIFTLKEHRRHAAQLRKNNTVLISQQCEKLLMWDDRLGIKTFLNEVVLNDNMIDYAFIIKQGEPYIHTFDKGFPRLLLPINVNAKHIPEVVRLRNENNETMYDIAILINNSKAVLHIGMSQKKIDHHLYLPISKTVLISLIILGIGVFLAAWVAALVTREIDRTTAKLRLNEEKLRLIIENSTNIFYTHTSEHELTYISPQTESVLGYKPREAMIRWTELTSEHPVNKKGYELTVKAIATSQAQLPYELELVHKNGRKVWVAVHEAPVVKNGKTVSMVGSLTDITKRKQGEEEIRKLSKVVETSSQSVVITDLETKIVYVNQGLLNNSHFENNKDIMGKSVLIFSDEASAKRLQTEVIPMLLSEGTWQGEMNVKKKDGTLFPAEMNCSVIQGETGEPEYLVSVYSDITDRKRAENALKAALKEKEVLLREIHHRVKNNLQIIISLLNLQSKKITNTIALESLTESNTRIRAMSLIHEILYQSDDLAKIDFETYINRLIKAIARAFTGSGGNISYSVTVAQIHLSIDDAVPIALIINELLTNIYKYAFPVQRRGKVEIILKKSDPQVTELSISDNGIGLPDDIDIHHSETLGLQLVSDLAEKQLEGSLQIERVNGTHFAIRFKPQKTNGKG
jgi:PAS domain S-box-containing protein